MIFDSESKFFTPSIIDECKEFTIVLNGFSKAYAMTGWRLGVAIGPEVIIDKMSLILQTIVSCVPPFIQAGGIEAINGDQTEAKRMLKIYKNRVELLVNGLNEVQGMNCIMPDGAIYVFPSIKNTGYKSIEFVNLLLERKKIAISPGTNFGVNGEGFVRLSAVNNEENIIKCINGFKELLGEKL